MAITFVASTRGPTSFPGSANNTSSVACAKPSGTVAGDVMLAFCLSGGDAHHSAPAGWSTVSRYENVSGLLTSTLFYKVAATEGTSYTFTDDEAGATPMCVEIVSYRGVNTSSPINVHTESSTAGTDTASAPSATSTFAGKFIWFRAGKTATVASEGSFTTSGGTSRQRTSNRGGSTQYLVQGVESSGGDKPAGALAGASFNSGVTLTASIERTIVLRTIGTSASGSTASTLGKVRSSLTGTRLMPAGPMVAPMPKLSATFTGEGAPPSGTVDTVLPRLIQAFAGNATGGPVAAALPHITSSLAGTIIHGAFTGSLGKVTSSVVGAVNPTGPFALTLPSVTSSVGSETRPHGDNVIVVEDERRAFRVYAEKMVEIYRRAVVIDTTTGPSGSLSATLPRLAGMFLGPYGDAGTAAMVLPGVTSALACSLENDAAVEARLPRLTALLTGVSDSANDTLLSATLPSLGGLDFEAYTSVTWVSDGGFVHGSGDLTVPLPAAYQINDVLLLAVTAAEGDTITGPEDWAEVNSSPQVTTSSATGNRLAVFWRVSDGSETAPVLADAGDHVGAIVHAFHGCDIVDGPIDVDGGIFQEVDDTTATMPSLSTTVPDEMVVYFGGHGVSTVVPEAALATADSELTNVTERSNDSTTDGAGGGLYVWTANCPPNTFVDSAAFSLADPSARTGIVVALLPLTTNGGLLATGGPIIAALPGLTALFKQGIAASLTSTLPRVSAGLTGGSIHGFVQFTLPRPVVHVEGALSSAFNGTMTAGLPIAQAAATGEVDYFFKFDDTTYGFDNGHFK